MPIIYNVTHPLRFTPYLRPMPWGGRTLARYLGKTLPANVPVGESWEVSDHPSHVSFVANATDFGVTLRQLMTDNRRELLGPTADRFDRFPWLIKLLDARDWLSVQVHPDDDAVETLLPGEQGKTEAWLVLSAEPTSRIYAGLLPGVGPKELRVALASGNAADCLYEFTPRAGDFVYLPAGTVHAIGGGVVVAEIQQTSDATFRLFDWNRVDSQGKPRALHVEQAFASIHWDAGPVQPTNVSGWDSPKRPLASSPYFDLEWIVAKRTLQLGGAGRLQALIVVEGRGRFDNGEYVLPGDVWILPAAMPTIGLQIDAPLSALLCTLPEST